MAKTYYKVIGKDGFAAYRASDRHYISVNLDTMSWSSKMLPGNVPVEKLDKAPRTIRVKGEAWGHQVVRTYLEGERPVTHTIAFRGDVGNPETKWGQQRPADPDKVYFDNYAWTDASRDGNGRPYIVFARGRALYHAVQAEDTIRLITLPNLRGLVPLERKGCPYPPKRAASFWLNHTDREITKRARQVLRGLVARKGLDNAET